MATRPGGCLFQLGYYFYSKTRVGYYMHRRDLAKARRKFEDGHSKTEPTKFNGLQILPIAILEDNYSYLVMDTINKTAVCVDPADAQAVQAAIEAHSVTPVAILTTHKHWDHSGGNSDLKHVYPEMRVYGGAMDNIPAVTHPVADGDVLQFGAMKFEVNFTPGHTVGHVIFRLDGSPFGAPDSLFSGDHLFLCGCGRMFEGAPGVMLRSLDHLTELKDDTLVWPGHEYAMDNLEFAIDLEQNNQAAQQKLAWVREQRKDRACTSPSTIEEEKQYNPFLRTNTDTILQSLGLELSKDGETSKDAVRAQALAEIRQRKDHFKYKL
ncbi:LOW QUALITY PROTEIN: probable hydrolase PNKD [Liolophura sinensis]|uniref:LOW QUALITY PROTEIN: probable hydrolase PNKD n=1 Tax=Liolophura sinensis TaxID=3198878 RepID=UPI0031590F57